MNLHMERVVCWPVGAGVRDCPASLAWAHEAWALPGGGLAVERQLWAQWEVAGDGWQAGDGHMEGRLALWQ